jgi:hypothetical protein
MQNRRIHCGEKGLLENDAPHKRLDTMVSYMGLNFAFRAGKEQRNMRIGTLTQIKLHTSLT